MRRAGSSEVENQFHAQFLTEVSPVLMLTCRMEECAFGITATLLVPQFVESA